MSAERTEPWTETKRRWEAVCAVERELTTKANDALAASAGKPGSKERGRSNGLFEAVALLSDALDGDATEPSSGGEGT